MFAAFADNQMIFSLFIVGGSGPSTPFFPSFIKERIMYFIKRFMQDDQGLETVEYAVMTALIVATLVTAITALAGAIEGRFGEVETVVDDIQ